MQATNLRFPNEWGSDSLDLIEIVMAFEDAFAEGIPDEEMEKMFTYFSTKDELLDYLRKRRKGGHLN